MDDKHTYVRGIHVNRSPWTPAIGETLTLTVECTNPHDTCTYAVAAVLQDGQLLTMFQGNDVS